MDAMNNVALGSLRQAARGGLLSRRRMAAQTSQAAVEFGFDPARIGELAANLSGGNQQKLLLARWRLNPPRVLLADEPTRGIDIGAKAEIMASLENMAEEGLGIVVVSSELEEVCAISHRVTVLSEGNYIATLDCSETEITPNRIMSTAFQLETADATA
jgi:ABC-type sugar transport system ATPase subunit